MNLADASITKLIAGNYPARTSDGSFIYVALPGLVESSDGVQVRTIMATNVDDATKANDNFAFPAVSPDGTLIAYNTLSNLVYVCRRDNGQVVSHFTENPPGGGLTGWERPTWTPDGRIVVAGQLGTPGIYISDAAFTTLTRFDPMINQPDHAKVSPKGDLVAFEANSHIYTIKLDGTGLKQMTMGNNQERFPTFNPDGSAIAAYSNLDLWTVNTDGSNLQMLSGGNPNNYYNFNTDQAFDWTN
jgi:TolB protein